MERAALDIPDDIFTEPDDVDPDTFARLGPLRRLAGVWEGQRGVDVESEGRGSGAAGLLRAHRDAADRRQANGPQLFYGLRYHVHINTREEENAFHDQVGYWLWGAGHRPDPADPGHPPAARWRSRPAMRSRTRPGWW